MKPILHFKINLNDVSRVTIAEFADVMKERLGDDYYLIFSLFDLSNPTQDATIMNFNGIDYTYEEIISLIERN